jgi:hypothetical protein
MACQGSSRWLELPSPEGLGSPISQVTLVILRAAYRAGLTAVNHGYTFVGKGLGSPALSALG